VAEERQRLTEFRDLIKLARKKLTKTGNGSAFRARQVLSLANRQTWEEHWVVFKKIAVEVSPLAIFGAI
jgi:hypothetical protein